MTATPDPRPDAGRRPEALAWMAEAVRVREARGCNRELRPRPPVTDRLDLASNDYLGLTRDPGSPRPPLAPHRSGVAARPPRDWSSGPPRPTTRSNVTSPSSSACRPRSSSARDTWRTWVRSRRSWDVVTSSSVTGAPTPRSSTAAGSPAPGSSSSTAATTRLSVPNSPTAPRTARSSSPTPSTASTEPSRPWASCTPPPATTVPRCSSTRLTRSVSVVRAAGASSPRPDWQAPPIWS